MNRKAQKYNKESTDQDSPKLPVQLEGSGLEVLVVLDERFVPGVEAVVGPVGEDAEQLLILGQKQ